MKPIFATENTESTDDFNVVEARPRHRLQEDSGIAWHLSTAGTDMSVLSVFSVAGFSLNDFRGFRGHCGL
jgi:hypothetical protein